MMTTDRVGKPVKVPGSGATLPGVVALLSLVVLLSVCVSLVLVDEWSLDSVVVVDVEVWLALLAAPPDWVTGITSAKESPAVKLVIAMVAKIVFLREWNCIAYPFLYRKSLTKVRLL